MLLRSDNETVVAEQQQPLPEEDRQLLWDSEHRGLLLSRFGWEPFLNALTQADRNGIARSLSPNFEARRPSRWRTTQHEAGEYQASRRSAEPGTDQQISGGQFVDWLLQQRREFASPPKARFKLTGCRPTDRTDLDREWEGSGWLILKGAAGDHGAAARRIALEFRTLPPNRAQFEKGAWLLSCRITGDDHVATEDLLLEEVAEQWGVDTGRLHDNWKSPVRPVNTGGVYLCDYNRDGCVDMLVTDSLDRHGLILYRGLLGGGFEDVTEAAGLPKAPHTIDAIFADLDNDGWEDLVLPGKAVFRNEQGRRFEDVTAQTNLDDWIYSVGWEGGLDSISGVSVADYNRDGLIDLYVTRADAASFDAGSWIDGRSGDSLGNQLLQNLGNWVFEDVTGRTGTHADQRSVFTSVWLDANNDSWPDVYNIHEFGAGLLLVNDRGRNFQPVMLTETSSDFGSMGLTCGDIDNDGQIDLYVSNMFSKAGNRVMDNLPPGFYDDTTMHKLRRMVAGNQLHRNCGNLQFDPIADRMDVAQVGWGWGPAMLDFNNDGWLDIYGTCGFMSRSRDKPDG